MTTKERINTDFMTAFKEGVSGREKKNFLSVLKGEIQLESSKETYKGEETDMAIVTKMAKGLKLNGDEDSLRELSYIECYLPQQMDYDRLVNVIDGYITEEDLSTMKDMGKVMGYLKSNFGGEYDGKEASTIIKEILG